MEGLSVECPICMNIPVIPVILSCNHIYCLDCIQKIAISETFKCPMDRKSLDILKDVKFDSKSQSKLLNSNKSLYLELVKIYLESKKTKKRVLRLSYGNEHKYIGDESFNKHQWIAFVRPHYDQEMAKEMFKSIFKEANLYKILGIEEDETKEEEQVVKSIENYISTVTFKLHHTFPNPTVVRDEPPFSVHRIGWGTFTIPTLVEFKKQYNIPDLKLNIDLNFESPITCSYHTIELPE